MPAERAFQEIGTPFSFFRGPRYGFIRFRAAPCVKHGQRLRFATSSERPTTTYLVRRLRSRRNARAHPRSRCAPRTRHAFPANPHQRSFLDSVARSRPRFLRRLSAPARTARDFARRAGNSVFGAIGRCVRRTERAGRQRNRIAPRRFPAPRIFLRVRCGMPIAGGLRRASPRTPRAHAHKAHPVFLQAEIRRFAFRCALAPRAVARPSRAGNSHRPRWRTARTAARR